MAEKSPQETGSAAGAQPEPTEQNREQIGALQALREQVKRKLEGRDPSSLPANVIYEITCKYTPSDKPRFVKSYSDELPELDVLANELGGGDFYVSAKVGGYYCGYRALPISEQVYGPPKIKKEEDEKAALLESDKQIKQLEEELTRLKSTQREALEKADKEKLINMITDLQEEIRAVKTGGQITTEDTILQRMKLYKELFSGDGRDNGGVNMQLDFMKDATKTVIETIAKIKEAPAKSMDSIAVDFLDEMLVKFRNATPEEIKKGIKEALTMNNNQQKDIIQISTDFLTQIHIGYEIRADLDYCQRVLDSKKEYAAIKSFLKSFETAALVEYITKNGSDIAEIQDKEFIDYLTRMIDGLKKKDGQQLAPDAQGDPGGLELKEEQEDRLPAGETGGPGNKSGTPLNDLTLKSRRRKKRSSKKKRGKHAKR